MLCLYSFLFVVIGLASIACSDESVNSAVRKDGKCINGAAAAVGDSVSVHYSGYIDESSVSGVHGKLFDSSLKRKKPFVFKLGSNQVIKGWEEGILEMCVGEKKTLIIPPELGYGSRGAGKDIPGGATLRFVVDLLGINGNKMNAEPSSDPNVFAEMDANRDLKVSYNEMAHWFLTMHPDKLDAIPRGIFEREDKNGDQTITWEEFDGPKGSSPTSYLDV